MIELFLKAETDIINEIGRLRSRGLVDYHATAALERVQKILRQLEDDCQTYAPRMIEMQFYVNHPEARKPLDVPETPEKHLRGYQNAFALTSTQTDIVERLTMNLMGQVAEASQNVSRNLENMLIGRVENDPYRRIGLSQAAAMQAAGQGAWKPVPNFVEALRQEGITAFVDRAGRNWNLHTYGSMVLRTASRQAEVLAVLTQDPEQDLYLISAHGSTCPLCAPLEGRVYSRSGRDPDFPSLAAAFGKMDPAGPDTLDNSWLNIHPNCLHQLIRWTPMGRSEEEIRKIKEFSSFEKNPVTRDPRTQKQVEAYRQKERDRARWLRDYRQWEKYREALGDRVPGTFETFRRHKLAGDEKFQAWKSAVQKQNRLDKSSKHDILKDIELKAIPITNKAIDRVPAVRPTGWSAERAKRLQAAHRELLMTVMDQPPGTEAGAIYSLDMQLLSREIGKEHHVELPSSSEPYISIHNHPDGLIFSHGDIDTFLSRSAMNAMSVVTNNGKVFWMEKLENYDGFLTIVAWKKRLPSIQACIASKDIEGYIGHIKSFISEVERYGTLFIAGED